MIARDDLIQAAEAAGFRLVPAADLPPRCEGLAIVLVTDRPAAQIAAKPQGKSSADPRLWR